MSVRYRDPQPVFVISAGQCGQATLSRILQAHPGVVCLSGVFSRPGAGQRLHQSRTGPEFWAELTDPATLYATLSSLTADPDDLYDELAGEVPHWPTATAGDQYLRLLAWFRTRFGGHLAVEQTDGSLEFADRLAQAYPRARFIYLYQDGIETVMSMDRDLREIHAERWLRATLAWITVYDGLPDDQRGSIRYENLVAAPAPALIALARFLDVPAYSGWLAHGCDLIRTPAVGRPYCRTLAPASSDLPFAGWHG